VTGIDDLAVRHDDALNKGCRGPAGGGAEREVPAEGSPPDSQSSLFDNTQMRAGHPVRPCDSYITTSNGQPVRQGPSPTSWTGPRRTLPYSIGTRLPKGGHRSARRVHRRPDPVPAERAANRRVQEVGRWTSPQIESPRCRYSQLMDAPALRSMPYMLAGIVVTLQATTIGLFGGFLLGATAGGWRLSRKRVVAGAARA